MSVIFLNLGFGTENTDSDAELLKILEKNPFFLLLVFNLCEDNSREH